MRIVMTLLDGYLLGECGPFMAVVAGSIIFSLGRAMHTKRQISPYPNIRTDTKKFCRLASWVQFCYLLFFIVKAAFSQEQLWDSHFVLGMALIHTVDRAGVFRVPN